MIQMRLSYMVSGIALLFGAAALVSGELFQASLFVSGSFVAYLNGLACEPKAPRR